MQGWDDVLPKTWVKEISSKEWTKGLPQKPGIYWLYGYPYGKFSGSKEEKPELLLAYVHKISNGLCIVADGQFIYSSEIEEPYYKTAIIPNVLPY